MIGATIWSDGKGCTRHFGGCSKNPSLRVEQSAFSYGETATNLDRLAMTSDCLKWGREKNPLFREVGIYYRFKSKALDESCVVWSWIDRLIPSYPKKESRLKR